MLRQKQQEERVVVHTVHLVYSKTQEPWKKGGNWAPDGMNLLGILPGLQALGLPWGRGPILEE